ncbi:10722_t:CDS:2, partial [Dentiscutata heterogama]
QQRKTIITQEDYDLIISILKNPTNTSNGTAKDYFWTKKGFYLHNLRTSQNPILQLMELKNTNKKTEQVICLFQNLYTVLEKIHSSAHKYSGSKKTFDATYALYTKEAAEVAAFLFSVLTVFGSSYILQSDNRREFIAQIIYELLSLWKEIHIINRWPRHPQSQEDNDRKDWSIGLPIVT